VAFISGVQRGFTWLEACPLSTHDLGSTLKSQFAVARSDLRRCRCVPGHASHLCSTRPNAKALPSGVSTSPGIRLSVFSAYVCWP
jgi:hypothetical protein